jgi:Fic family protein
MNNIFLEIDQLQREINSLRPLEAPLLKQIKEYYRVGLTYSSNAIEGNSLTESETKIVLEEGITIGGKPLKDHYEAVGHGEAYDFLYSLVKDKTIQEEDIKNLHRIFYKRIDETNAGVYRNVRAIITGSKYPLPPPERIPELMKKFMGGLQKGREGFHPVESAARAHKEFVFIHPFVDGNGRMARLLMNLILMRDGFNIAIITPVMRGEYIASLEKAHTDDSVFIELIARMVMETQKDYLRLFKT